MIILYIFATEYQTKRGKENSLITRYPSNYYKTSKYSIITFIPLNLYEQFHRVANIFFLTVVGVQLIPGKIVL